MSLLSNVKITTTSLFTWSNLQKIVLCFDCKKRAELLLQVYQQDELIESGVRLQAEVGANRIDILLAEPKTEFDAVWRICNTAGEVVFERVQVWKKPRRWQLYAIVSSHTDIGLHNSQYIQRANSCRFLDTAMALCDETESWEENSRYRYVIEGTWFFNNYESERGEAPAKRLVEEYIRTGKIGVCSGVAGNHIQTYGLEELCRSAYEKKRLRERWDIHSETLTMIDNNGLPMPMILPYAEAGYKNLIFAPNQWNPLLSTIWEMDESTWGAVFNPDAGGGGSRIDVRYDSSLPMVFNWSDGSGHHLTVWCSTQYDLGGSAFGLKSVQEPFASEEDLEKAVALAEERTWQQLEKLEQRYPYDIWLFCCYADDMQPNIGLNELFLAWNKKWKSPQFSAVGNPDPVFRALRDNYGEQIPTLQGDITGGWYQHPLSVPELISEKFNADRLLPIAEKWSAIAGVLDANYAYPQTEFRRAWDYLLFNDEHSYGTSGYQGRRVYETWIQHRDWIEKALYTAESEIYRALRSIASKIESNGESIVVFNPTLQARTEEIYIDDGARYALVDLPPFGYQAVPKTAFATLERVCERTDAPPSIENGFYKIEFAKNGAIRSIYDKEFGVELLDTQHAYGANQLVYTKDNHQTFLSPIRAQFEVVRDNVGVCVIARTDEPNLGAEIEQIVTLRQGEKKIEIDDRILHPKAMFNRKRYYRYLYYAFPFLVQGGRRFCHLNGAVAEYGKSVTGHGTDTYTSARDWCCVENERFGVALLMKDSQLIEFDRIHPDKTDFGHLGDGSQIFAYIANDWLQMHTSGGSRLRYRFQYAVTSYRGGYQQARIPQLAERFVTPVQTLTIPRQTGSLPVNRLRFMEIDTTAQFLCLKRADDGRGLIARFYGNGEKIEFGKDLCAEDSTVDEYALTGREHPCTGFVTYRLQKNSVRLQAREVIPPNLESETPLAIGSVYTGLITEPKAAAGEDDGHLYLLWGASKETSFSHYKLYRSEVSGFVADEKSFVADIYPEAYAVGRYEDKGLKTHTAYYYRVCAVNRQGVCGALSKEFCGITRERMVEE